MKMTTWILCPLLAVAVWSCGGDDDGDSTGDLGDLGDLVAIDGATGESDGAVGGGSCEPSGSCLQASTTSSSSVQWPISGLHSNSGCVAFASSSAGSNGITTRFENPCCGPSCLPPGSWTRSTR